MDNRFPVTHFVSTSAPFRYKKMPLQYSQPWNYKTDLKLPLSCSNADGGQWYFCTLAGFNGLLYSAKTQPPAK